MRLSPLQLRCLVNGWFFALLAASVAAHYWPHGEITAAPPWLWLGLMGVIVLTTIGGFCYLGYALPEDAATPNALLLVAAVSTILYFPQWPGLKSMDPMIPFVLSGLSGYWCLWQLENSVRRHRWGKKDQPAKEEAVPDRSTER